MKTKILPVKVDTTLKIECWTYYKLAVIETMPNYMNWLSSHMNIYYAPMGSGIYFGNCPIPYSTDYYKDILNIEEIDLFEIKPQSIIEQIIRSIKNDYYYVLFLRTAQNEHHEAFIYGYDDNNKCFYSFSVQNNVFTDSIISYEQVYRGYSYNIEFYRHNTDLYYSYKLFGPLMSRFNSRSDYFNKNYAYNFFDKINMEVYGRKIITTENYDIDNFDSPNTYYTGISCLSYLCNTLKTLCFSNEVNDKQDIITTLQNNLFKLLEHRKLLCKSIIWYENKWNILDERLMTLRKKYSQCCNEMDIICNLFLKFSYTHDNRLLENIIKKIELLYQHEKATLGEYTILIRNWYIHNIVKIKL